MGLWNTGFLKRMSERAIAATTLYVPVRLSLMESAVAGDSVEVARLNPQRTYDSWYVVGLSFKNTMENTVGKRNAASIGQAIIDAGNMINLDSRVHYTSKTAVMIPQKVWNVLVSARQDFARLSEDAHNKIIPWEKPDRTNRVVMHFDFVKKEFCLPHSPAISLIGAFSRDVQAMIETVQEEGTQAVPMPKPEAIASSHRVGRPAGTGFRP